VLAHLILQRDFVLLRDFGYDSETLRFTLTGEPTSKEKTP